MAVADWGVGLLVGATLIAGCSSSQQSHDATGSRNSAKSSRSMEGDSPRARSKRSRSKPLCGFIPMEQRCSSDEDEGKACRFEGETCGGSCSAWGCHWLSCEDGKLVSQSEENAPETVEDIEFQDAFCEAAREGQSCSDNIWCRPEKDCGQCESCDFLGCKDGQIVWIHEEADEDSCSACRESWARTKAVR